MSTTFDRGAVVPQLLFFHYSLMQLPTKTVCLRERAMLISFAREVHIIVVPRSTIRESDTVKKKKKKVGSARAISRTIYLDQDRERHKTFFDLIQLAQILLSRIYARQLTRSMFLLDCVTIIFVRHVEIDCFMIKRAQAYAH